jgi:hypothetical protein
MTAPAASQRNIFMSVRVNIYGWRAGGYDPSTRFTAVWVQQPAHGNDLRRAAQLTLRFASVHTDAVNTQRSSHCILHSHPCVLWTIDKIR